MSQLANERVAWFNGEFMPEREVRIPFRDSSWVYGDGCFDMTRTFGHRLFKVKEHVDRLYRSLKYLRIDPGFGPDKMCALTEELFERNRHLLGPDDDYWVGQRISRGVKEAPGDNIDYHGPNVVLECNPLPFAKRAKLFKDGIKVMIPSHRRTPPDSLTPRAKTHNYLNLIVADQEVQSIDPEAWAVLLDVNGNLCEGMGSNIFIVRDGEILTPREKFVLPGVSRQTAIDLAREEGLSLREADIDLYDAYNADEIFLTSTSLCICPVTKVNGVAIGPAGPGVGAGDAAHRGRLPALRQPRLRRAVHEVLRRGRGDAGVLIASPAAERLSRNAGTCAFAMRWMPAFAGMTSGLCILPELLHPQPCNTSPDLWHGTTILTVRKGGTVAIGGDGQVSIGQTIVKANAKKVRRLAKGDVIGGFAGATADAFTLFERLEAKLEQYPGQLMRAAVELAKDWRTDRYLRRLEAMMIVADKDVSLVLTGTGDVLEPEAGVMGIGSGGNYALAAARALVDTEMDAEAIVRRSLDIAADICVYTNRNVTVETLNAA